jgi:hypothetical protein
MAEPAKVRHEAVERATCLYCGVEVGEVPSPVKGLCIPCAARVLPAPAPPKRESNVHLIPLRAAEPVERPEPRRSRSAPCVNDALAELIDGPGFETPGIVSELLAAHKRVAGFMALIPFAGPWLVQRSDAHTEREKRILTWISIALTAAVVGGLVSMIPTDAQRRTRLQDRMQAQMSALAAIAGDHRSQHGAYPGSSVWRRYAERADPRFYDPWGRPYLYEATDTGISLSSLGRDGAPGGDDEDTDVSTTFPPPPAQ